MGITLWGRSSSSNVQKVRWALAELGLAYEHVALGGKYGGNKEPKYLELNPNGTVPTLRDGDLVVWESHAILRYLAAAYGGSSLWPVEARERAKCDQWVDWAATEFQKGWIEVFWSVVRTPEAQRDEAKIERQIAITERCLAIVDAQLGKTEWLGGDRFTYADIPAGVAMFRWNSMEIARQRHPNVERWHAGLRERGAYRETVEIDYSELVGRLSF
jgi:glutathione S-transferase